MLTTISVLFRYLALVCLVREDKFDKQGLIDYNIHCFRNAIHEVRIPRTLLSL
jgi:hypothetical protein